MPKSASVLVCNPGSSSIKWSSYPDLRDPSRAAGAGSAPVDELDERLRGLLADFEPAYCLVRFVHGGNRFIHPTVVDHGTLAELESLGELAPLHNRASLACLRLLLELAPAARLLAVFDTGFFHDLPEVARRYGLPEWLVRKHGLRRFGFHGFAHAGMTRQWESLSGQRGEHQDYRLVTAQLGSGCSMAAIRNGGPVDTSMGFSPNEGLLMSTRSGDLDPGLLTWLQRHEGWDAERTDALLNQESGWLGVSGESANLGDLLASGSAGAERALALFAHRFRKTLGAYYALLGGLDGLVLGGGVAEHSLAFCRHLLADLGHLGIHPGPGREQVLEQPALRLSARESPVQCWVVAGNEDSMMVDAVLREGLVEQGKEARKGV